MENENKDRVCDECGLIHPNGLERHGRCYYCGGDLVAWNKDDYERTAVTPKGIEIYEQKKQPKKDIDVDINYDFHEGRGEDNYLL